MHAADHDRKQTLESLIKHDCDLSLKDKHGNDALDYAVKGDD